MINSVGITVDLNITLTSTATTFTNTTFSTIASTNSQIVTSTTTASHATYTGGRAITGTCQYPAFTSLPLQFGQNVLVPIVGCSGAKSDCCPFQNSTDTMAALPSCPPDYFTTSKLCCPR